MKIILEIIILLWDIFILIFHLWFSQMICFPSDLTLIRDPKLSNSGQHLDPHVVVWCWVV